MLLVLLLIGMATALFVYGMVDSNTLALRRDKDTAAVLADIKLALIGYAASDANRPGELPCPDVNNDGQLTLGSDFTGGAGSPCVSLLGRLPWKTLGLPDLRDGRGERFWYALSDNFHAGATPPLNSNTMGQLTVTGDAPATNVVAIVFSPGEVLGTQVRDAANENNVANYLEGENANGDTIFTTGAVSATFNDRLLVITTAELMPPVERRVARELRSALQAYKANSACGCYPWADISDGISQSDLNRGRVPTTALPENWGTGAIPALPTWFVNNNWRLVIYYSVGRNFLQAGGGACVSCVSPDLSVDGVSGKEAVILMPGPVGVGSEIAVVDAHTNWPFDYFEDAQNNDHSDTSSGNDFYVTPSSTAYARDRLYTIP